jgi:hypothetical protein
MEVDEPAPNKDAPPPPRFEIKKRAPGAPRRAPGEAHRDAQVERGVHVELGHLRRHVRDLPELAQRAVHRVPGEPVAEQRERSVHRLRLLRPRAPAGSRRVFRPARARAAADARAQVFHLDCIQRWLKTRSVCPLCNKEWEFAKIERIPGYGSLGT